MPTYIEVLADLKAEFGKKIFLTPSDIAPVIGRTPDAQAALRGRGLFPIPYSKLGGLVVIRIYDLAQYIRLSTENRINSIQLSYELEQPEEYWKFGSSKITPSDRHVFTVDIDGKSPRIANGSKLFSEID